MYALSLDVLRLLECSWIHEYFGCLAKKVKPGLTLTLQETRSILESMNTEVHERRECIDQI